jgi:DNA-binding NarL/FixJ family response regulator
MIRVILADDQALVRGGFRMILAAQPDIEVVAEVQDGAQAVAQARALRPDVVLMDVRMPVMDGLEATRRILSDSSATTRVVVVTTFDLDEYVFQALRAGASGFLLKDTRPEILADAIRTVAGGEALLAPAVMHRLIEQYATREATHRQAAVLDTLTEREVDVLRLIGRGRSNGEIATELFVAETTIKTHITRIFGKLDLRDRAQAVVVAYETGLVEIGQAQ